MDFSGDTRGSLLEFCSLLGYHTPLLLSSTGKIFLDHWKELLLPLDLLLLQDTCVFSQMFFSLFLLKYCMIDFKTQNH